MSTILLLAGLAAAHDEPCAPRRVELCRVQLVREICSVRVPATYWDYDPCSGRAILRRAERLEPRVRYRYVRLCVPGCTRHAGSFDEELYFRAR